MASGNGAVLSERGPSRHRSALRSQLRVRRFVSAEGAEQPDAQQASLFERRRGSGDAEAGEERQRGLRGALGAQPPRTPLPREISTSVGSIP